ncbi:MAG: glycosyltransferase family 2 protein [Ardenticatenales bacterium]
MTVSQAASAVERRPTAAGLTAIVLTLDEVEHLPDCLASLRFAEALLVVDSGSRDGTRALAEAAGATVIDHPFVNYSRQRQFALGLSATRWVLFVDADERVPPPLADEIRRIVTASGTGGDDGGSAPVRTVPGGGEDRIPAGYWIPRANVFWGRTLRGGGWWPDHQLRLLDARRARYDPLRAVHEVAALDGPSGRLVHPLVHLNYASWAEFDRKQRAYAHLDALRRQADGWRTRPHQWVTQPLRAFYHRFVALRGWRDGWLGLRLAVHMAGVEALTLSLLRGLSRGDSDRHD